MFYVLEGTLSFRCNGKTFDLSKGGFIFMPHSVEHSYTIHNEEPVRLIVVTAPMREGIQGGWGGFVSDMGKKDQ
jgi:mannose-6-phosphate isomerase-like protein (cupin superfamily)